MAYPIGHEPDPPIIRNMEATGYPDGKAPEYPRCPACGEPECVNVYVRRKMDSVLGCESCIEETNAADAGEKCPVCGAACELLYKDTDNDILGCESCVRLVSAWDIPSCFDS